MATTYSADRLVTTIHRPDGSALEVYAQDARHARRAREILRHDPARVGYLNVDGIRITVRERPGRGPEDRVIS